MAQTHDYTWYFDATETSTDNIVVAFDIFETNQTTSDDNVHQARVTFQTNATQQSSGVDAFTLKLYVPLKNTALQLTPFSTPYECDMIFSPTAACNPGNPEDQGCLIELSTMAGNGNYQLDIRYKATDFPDYGSIMDSDPASIKVDEFILIAENVTLPDTSGPSGKKEITAQIRSIKVGEMPGTPSGTEGVVLDNPPEGTITIPSSLLSPSYEPLAGIQTDPYTSGPDTASAGFAGTYEDESDDTPVAGQPDPDNDQLAFHWEYNSIIYPPADPVDPTSPTYLVINEGADNYIYLVVTETLRNVPAGDIIQEGKTRIRLVVKDPPEVTVNVTSIGGVPPVTIPPVDDVPTQVSLTASVVHHDPITETEPFDDGNSTDYEIVNWEIKKDGDADTIDIPASSLTDPLILPDHEIGQSGRYRIKASVRDDYNIEGGGYADVLITPVETMVFPPHRGVPTDSDPPGIDGILYRVDANGDGIIDPVHDIIENGWTGSYRITYQNGTYPPNVAFQGVRYRYTPCNYVYLSFEVRNDQTFDNDDVIVLTFSADNALDTPTNDRRLFIFPLYDNSGACDGPLPDYQPASDKYDKPAQLIQVYNKNAGGDWSLITEDPAVIAGMDIDVKVHSWQDGGGSVYSWDVEAKIPTNTASGTANWIDMNDNFLFYFDVIRINSTVASGADGYATQFTWPRKIPVPHDELETYPFPVQLWGSSYKTYTDQCKGVSVDAWNDIGVDDGTPYLSDDMSLTANNRFVARITNTSEKVVEDGSNPGTAIGEQIPADDVVVTFKIANWGAIGYDGNWREIPSSNSSCPETPGNYNNNPTCPHDVQAGAGVGVNPKDEFYLDWTVTPSTDIDDRDGTAYYTAHPHQCIKVELDSFSDTNFINTGVARNMDFYATASDFSRIARIDTKGCGTFPGSSETNRVLLIVSERKWNNKYDDDKHTISRDKKTITHVTEALPESITKFSTSTVSGGTSSGENSITSFLDYIVNGYIETGEVLIINEHRYKIVEPFGSFGYVVRHSGEVKYWEHDIEGAEKVTDNTYVLDIPIEGFVDVNTIIKPIESLGLCVSLHGGASIPLTRFANDYDMGWNVIADIGFKVLPRFYIMGLFGYNLFPAKAAGVDDTSILNISLNAKYYVPLIRPFLDLGIGVGPEMYIRDMDFSHIDVGYNVDLSLDYTITNSIVLEAGAIYHSHFNEEYWFIQAHGGLLFRF